MLKAIILIGGPQKGTRFRPLSLDIPKPLFPVAGLPIIQHHIEACANVASLNEILLIGNYPTSQLQQFVTDMQNQYNVNIRYLQEFTDLGTAGGMYHFRDQIRWGSPDAFFVMNGDVCADFPLNQLYEFHKSKNNALISIMGTEAARTQSLHYGCMATTKTTGEVTHYVEKPSSYVSTLINCGVYVCSLDIFQTMATVFNQKQLECYRQANGKDASHIQFEQEILAPLAGTGKLYALQVTKWWSQLKTAGAAIYANRHYLQLYRTRKPERLARNQTESGDDNRIQCTIIPDVYIHASATVHPTAVLGPNVSVGAGAVIGPGVRLRESIVLAGAKLEEHCVVLHSIVGRGSYVGRWARVEGTPGDPDPNKPFTKMDNPALFNIDGRLNPSITTLGSDVTVAAEIILLNSIVLPHKELTRSYKNEIIL